MRNGIGDKPAWQIAAWTSLFTFIVLLIVTIISFILTGGFDFGLFIAWLKSLWPSYLSIIVLAPVLAYLVYKWTFQVTMISLSTLVIVFLLASLKDHFLSVHLRTEVGWV